MGQEIERKFLVKDDSYKLEAYAHSHIVQGYICSARGRTVRVRIRDNKGYLTIKGASNDSGTSRYEWEKEISLQEAEELMKLCEPGVIDKIHLHNRRQIRHRLCPYRLLPTLRIPVFRF